MEYAVMGQPAGARQELYAKVVRAHRTIRAQLEALNQHRHIGGYRPEDIEAVKQAIFDRAHGG